MASIAVIIPTHNRHLLLKQALMSVMQQTLPPEEIIVCDDASDPPVSEKALRDEFGGKIQVLRNDTPHGLAWVRHQGVEASTADYVTHLDDDDLLAPNLLEEGVRILDTRPELEVLFLGVKGFGDRSDHFNKVQPTGVTAVIRHGHGKRLTDHIVQFDGQLFDGLLRTVPMAFQRVMLRREVWNSVSAFRRRAYRQALGTTSEEEARRHISGCLRDSEWSLYAGIICNQTALVDHALYLQRCEGQGLTSQPLMREQHVKQLTHIKEILFQASNLLAEFKPWRSRIRDHMSETYFGTAYYYFYHGNRLEAWRYLRKAFLTQAEFSQIRFFARTCFPRRVKSD